MLAAAVVTIELCVKFLPHHFVDDFGDFGCALDCACGGVCGGVVGCLHPQADSRRYVTGCHCLCRADGAGAAAHFECIGYGTPFFLVLDYGLAAPAMLPAVRPSASRLPWGFRGCGEPLV